MYLCATCTQSYKTATTCPPLQLKPLRSDIDCDTDGHSATWLRWYITRTCSILCRPRTSNRSTSHFTRPTFKTHTLTHKYTNTYTHVMRVVSRNNFLSAVHTETQSVGTYGFRITTTVVCLSARVYRGLIVCGGR